MSDEYDYEDVFKKQSNYVSFGKAIKLYFKKFGRFSGRASRSEFWWAQLFRGLIVLPLFPLFFVPYLNVPLSIVINLAFLVGDISVAVRRLHDIGLHGTYYLRVLIPFAGIIIVIIKMFRPSDGDNQWGSVFP